MSEKIDDFKMVHISNVYSRNSDGQLVTQVNVKTEADMAVYGEVWATLTFLQNYETPDAESGQPSPLLAIPQEPEPHSHPASPAPDELASSQSRTRMTTTTELELCR